jgi:hypothetical protein
MDEFLQFVKDYVKADQDAELAKHGDPDEVFFEKLRAVNGFFGGIQSAVSRAPNMSTDELKTLENQRGDISGRTIFRISRHTHPEHGEVFQVLLSGPMSFQKKKVGMAYWAKREGDRFKFITTERLMGGWQHVVGKKMAGVSAPAEVRELGTPVNAADVGNR